MLSYLLIIYMNLRLIHFRKVFIRLSQNQLYKSGSKTICVMDMYV